MATRSAITMGTGGARNQQRKEVDLEMVVLTLEELQNAPQSFVVGPRANEQPLNFGG